jgi:hypothetical protein
LGLLWAVLSALVLAGGLLALIPVIGPYRRPGKKTGEMIYEPPGELPPAMAGVLHDGGAKPNWYHALGTLFDLASRGVMMIEELPKEGWFGSADFRIQFQEKPTDLLPHERGLLDLLFQDKSGRPVKEVKLSKLSGLISSSRWKRFSETLQAEMKADFLIDPARGGVKQRLVVAALVLGSLLMAVVFALTFLFVDTLGYWPLIMVGAIFLVMLAWVITASSISNLSDEGAALAAEWEPFHKYLHAVTRDKASATHPDMFEQYLPYAAVYGLLHDWAKRFEKKGWTRVPAYFRAYDAAGSGSMAAFVVLASTSSSSGGAGSTAATGAGAAGAGAAGGGASGAG